MRRIGKFMVDDILIEHPGIVGIFAEMELVPLRVERLGYIRSYEYIGMSKYFVPVEDGSRLIEYKVVINEVGDKLSLHSIEPN